MLWAFRSSAAEDVLFSAGFPGLWLKRLGFGVFVDLMPRVEVCDRHGRGAVCWMKRARERVDEGRRKDGGNWPHVRGVFGGIVVWWWSALW